MSRIPLYTFTGPFTFFITVGHANITPNDAFARSGMLKKITYPTGGYTSFEYEMNRYLDNSVSTQGAGMRIKKMTLHDPVSNKSSVREYKYGLNESGNGTVSFYPKKEDYFRTMYRYRTDGMGIMWEYAEQRFSWGDHVGTEHLQLNIPIFYEYVTEYTGEGKIIYRHSYAPDSYMKVEGINSLAYMTIQRFVNQPRLIDKKIYNQSGSLLREESFTYSSYHSTVKGMTVKQIVDDGNDLLDLIYNPSFNYPGKFPFFYLEYYIHIGDIKMLSHTVKQY
jgi:hypothetical protein